MLFFRKHLKTFSVTSNKKKKMDKKRKRCIEYHTEITESNDNEEGPQKKKRRHSEQPQTRTIQLLEVLNYTVFDAL